MFKGWVMTPRWRVFGGIAIGLLVLAAVAFVAVQYATASSLGGVMPPEGGIVDSSEVVVSVALPGFEPGAAQVEMLVDAEPVPPDVLEQVAGGVRAQVRLRDGAHWARVTVDSGNIFSRRMVTQWEFTVDTMSPSVTLRGHGQTVYFVTPESRVDLVFREPVEAVLEIDGTEVALEGEGGDRFAEFQLSAGKHEISVSATDPAGHVTTKNWTAWADFNAPKVTEISWPEATWDEPTAGLVVEVEDDQPEGIDFALLIDGAPADFTRVPVPENENARRFVADTAELAEGEHTIEYEVTDRGGRTQGRAETVLVDSTETFGAREMGLGARGRDVTELQKVLVRRDLLTGDPSGVFDEPTSAALVSYKSAKGLDPTPTLDQKTLVSLLGAIRIDISERRLYLYDGEEVVKTYPVAVGVSRYPTPKGDFRIINKAYHPTWTPPPSPWAAGLEPVPAGPGNPLGTRWMGLSTPHVGIHGTYASGSIGTAASHGCIRMYIRDVEEIFELVYVGTPVQIVP